MDQLSVPKHGTSWAQSLSLKNRICLLRGQKRRMIGAWDSMITSPRVQTINPTQICKVCMMLQPIVLRLHWNPEWFPVFFDSTPHWCAWTHSTIRHPPCCWMLGFPCWINRLKTSTKKCSRIINPRENKKHLKSPFDDQWWNLWWILWWNPIYRSLRNPYRSIF